MAGYAADLINLKEKLANVPSVIDGKKIKSSLSPFFTQNKTKRSLFAILNPSLMNE